MAAEKTESDVLAAAARPSVLLRTLHTFVSIIHNAYINCAALIVLAAFVHGSQWAHLTAETATRVAASSYIFDAASNALNLLFVLRFCLGWFFLPFEAVFAVFQTAYIAVCVFHDFAWVYVLYDFFDVVCLIQVVIPVLLNVIHIYETVTKGDTFAGFVIAFNNNFVPLLISNSFIFINLGYPLFSADAWVVEAFIYAMISLKFFCLYQYIMYELGVVQPCRNFKNYLLVATCLLLMSLDLAFAYRVGGFQRLIQY